eukprot:5185141-Pleurochrysis_carterae.AAC.2
MRRHLEVSTACTRAEIAVSEGASLVALLPQPLAPPKRDSEPASGGDQVNEFGQCVVDQIDERRDRPVKLPNANCLLPFTIYSVLDTTKS